MGLPVVTAVRGSRRQFFKWVTTTAAAVIGLGLAVPLVGYVISPTLKRRVRSWVDVACCERTIGLQPQALDYVATIQAVWAVKQDDGQVMVFSPLCTHLGCGYHWDAADRKFKCPCHGSVYDVTGQVLAGPASRRLDALLSKVEQGRVLVMYKEFKSGVTGQVEL